MYANSTIRIVKPIHTHIKSEGYASRPLVYCDQIKCLELIEIYLNKLMVEIIVSFVTVVLPSKQRSGMILFLKY